MKRYRLQSRYVEYSGGRKVYSVPWRDYLLAAPEGCLTVGWMTRQQALEVKRNFERDDRKAGCSNFEYRIW